MFELKTGIEGDTHGSGGDGGLSENSSMVKETTIMLYFDLGG